MEKCVPVTIKDIAKVAGVSHTTVSRALNSNPAISPETTARIQEIARNLGYTPSAVAQSLLSKQTRTIGMVVTTIADPFIAPVVAGVERVAQNAGYSVFLTTSHNDPDKELEVVKTLQRRRVDAIIVTASRVGRLYTDHLGQIQVPIVLINDQEEGEYLHSVAVDDRQGARLAVEHLVELGHRQIGYVGAPNRPKSNRRRLQGYMAALEQADLKPDPNSIISLEDHDDFRRGRASLDELLKSKATAVFCYNDLTAIGLLTACRDQGISVPESLSVVGFDNIEPALYVTPPLTTLHQPRSKLGELAMRMALDLLGEQKVQDQLLSCALVARGSTAMCQQ